MYSRYDHVIELMFPTPNRTIKKLEGTKLYLEVNTSMIHSKECFDNIFQWGRSLFPRVYLMLIQL